MIKAIVNVAALAFCVAGCVATTPETALDAPETAWQGPPPVRIMILGSYHMAAPNLDLVNAKVDSVLTPKRQGELQALARELAAFDPTVIAIERATDAPDYVDREFEAFTDEMLAATPSESVQIGYRVARLSGVDRVHGVDEQPGEGEPDYFPFGPVAKLAAETGRQDVLNAILGGAQEMVSGLEEMQASASIPELLRYANTVLSDHDFYFRMFEFDEGENQPGSELQAYWFMRNAKIFSKILQVTEPGDRVIVVYGSGHKYWLDHLVRETPGYDLVDPLPFLDRAAAGIAD